MQQNVLSVSLKPELVELVRREATASDRPVSRVVAEALRDWAQKKGQAENG